MATTWRRTPKWAWRVVPGQILLAADDEHRTLEGLATAVWIVLDEPGTAAEVVERIVELDLGALEPGLVDEAIEMMRSAGVISETEAADEAPDWGGARNGVASLARRRTAPLSEWTVDSMLRAVAVQHLVDVPDSLRTVALPEGPVDAGQLIATAEAQRLLGSLLETVMAGTVELADADYQYLVERQSAVMMWCIMIEARLGEIRQWFDEAGGVDHLVIKGSAVAHLDEVDPAIRSFADLDLLVRAEHLDRAVAVLTERGATRPWPERRPAFDRRFAKSVTMTCSDGIEIDLHRTLCDGVHAERIPNDELFDHTTSFALGGAEVGALSRPHRFLHSAYHAVLGSPTPKLSSLRDLAGYAASPDLQPAGVAPIAVRWGGAAVLATAVRAALDEFDLSIPEWNDWLARVVVPERELRIIERQRVGGSSFGRNSLDRVREMRSWRRRAAYTEAVLLPGRPHLHGRGKTRVGTRVWQPLDVRLAMPTFRQRAGRGTKEPHRSDKPLRVAILTPTLWHAGGMVRWNRDLVRSLEQVTSPQDLEIHLLIRGSAELAQRTVREFGLRSTVHPVPVRSTTPRERLDSIRRTNERLAALEPSVVHVPMGSVWLLGVRRPPFQVIITCHSYPSKELIPWHDRVLARRLVRAGRGTLVTNVERFRPLLDDTIGIPRGTSITLPVGTDPHPVDQAESDREVLREAFAIEKNERVVLSIGRLVDVKRFDRVVEVARLARDRGQRVRFLIAGDGPARATIERLIEASDLRASVHLLGHVAEPAGLYLGSDALLLTSDHEGGGPLVVIEALSAGLPVVATDVGGTTELLDDPLNGCVVESSSPEGLTNALLTELARPVRRSKRSADARNRFSLDTMGETHLELLNQLAGDAIFCR